MTTSSNIVNGEINVDLRAEAARIDETIGTIVAARVEVAAQWAKGASIAKIGGFSAIFDSAGAVAGSVAAGVASGAALGAMIGGAAGPIGSAIGGVLGLLVGAFALDGVGVVTVGPSKCSLPDGQIIEAPSCQCVTPTSTGIDGSKSWPFFDREWNPRSLAEASNAELAAWLELWEAGVYRTVQGEKLLRWGRAKSKPSGTEEQILAVAMNDIRELYEDTKARATILAQCLPSYVTSPRLKLLAERLFKGRFGVDASNNAVWYWQDDALLGCRISSWPAYVPVGPGRANAILLAAVDAGLSLADFERIATLDPRLGILPASAGIETLSAEELRAYYANASAIALAAAGQIGELAQASLVLIEAPIWIADDAILEAMKRLADPSLSYVAEQPAKSSTSRALFWLLVGVSVVGVVYYGRKSLGRSKRSGRRYRGRSR